jgi:FAD synthase
MMRLRCEQKELSELTFQPEISKKATKMGKTIVAAKLSEDPSKIIEWAKNEELKKEESRMQQLKEKEVKELETCTFAPQTKDCPAYIKRIAKSMAVVKAARSSDQTSVYQSASKPTWK